MFAEFVSPFLNVNCICLSPPPPLRPAVNERHQAETDWSPIISFLLDLLITELEKIEYREQTEVLIRRLELLRARGVTASRYVAAAARTAVLCPASITENESLNRLPVGFR